MASTSKATTRKTATPKVPTGRCGLTLRINGTAYRVRPIRAESGGIRAFRLMQRDGGSHDVSCQPRGAECTCGDFVFRRDGIDPAGCKHVRAARACGLID